MMKSEFLNPYNFVKLPESKRTKYNDSDKHTGVIEYSITTKTPLFIPNTSSETAFSQSDKCVDTKDIHQSYDFYSYTMLEANKRYENEYHSPVIPGSEIRGMVRSIYETLTASCMSGLTEDETPIKKVDGTYKPGLITKNRNSYAIFEAKSIRTDFDDKKVDNKKLLDGEKIFIKKPDKNQKTINSYLKKYTSYYNTEGYIINWGATKKNKEQYVFHKKNEEALCHIDKKFIESEETLLKIIKDYKENLDLEDKDKKEEYEKCDIYETALKNFINGASKEEYFPVNYIALNNSPDNVYISPYTISKEVYKNTIGKLAGEFAPCKDDSEVCPACALFGRIGEKHTSSIASKLRFADLYPVDKNKALKDFYYKDTLTIQTLANPQLNNVAFYLQRPNNANFWTYDYYIDKNDLINVKIEPGKLRGRKYYWHHKKCSFPEQVEVTKLNKTIRPVKSDITFNGKIYFEDISKRQLKELIWIINGGNVDSKGNADICYKLGTGKPLGLGSVKCNVNNVFERVLNINGEDIEQKEIDIADEYKEVSYDNVGFCESAKAEFLNICNYNAVPEDIMISYPRQKDQMEDDVLEEGFLWYQNNQITKQKNNKKIDKHNKVCIKQILPTAEKVTTLKANVPQKASKK